MICTIESWIPNNDELFTQTWMKWNKISKNRPVNSDLYVIYINDKLIFDFFCLVDKHTVAPSHIKIIWIVFQRLYLLINLVWKKSYLCQTQSINVLLQINAQINYNTSLNTLVLIGAWHGTIQSVQYQPYKRQRRTTN